MRWIALAATLLLLPFALLSCGGDDEAAPASSSSAGTIQAYFAQLDRAGHAHRARFEAFTPSSDNDTGDLFVLTSLDQMLREVGSIEAPPLARDAQRRLVDAFTDLVAEMRESINQYGATATPAPDQTESPHKVDVDKACADLAAFAAANAISSDFMCLADAGRDTTATTKP